MPTINKIKYCHLHGKYNAIENKRCPRCEQERINRKRETDKKYDRELRAKDRKAIYNTIEWQIVREEALIRDNLMCQKCGSIAEEVHHIIELKDDITKAFDLDNLMSLCRTCHIRIHKKT